MAPRGHRVRGCQLPGSGSAASWDRAVLVPPSNCATRRLGSAPGTASFQHPGALSVSPPGLGDLSVLQDRQGLPEVAAVPGEESGRTQAGTSLKQDSRTAGQRDRGTPETRAAGRRGSASGGRRHHAARRAAGSRAGVRPDPGVLHKPWGGRQSGGWEPEGDQSQSGQEKRRWRTRCAERVREAPSYFGVPPLAFLGT